MTIRRILSLLFALLSSLFATATVHGGMIERQGEQVYLQQIQRRILPREKNPDTYALLENIYAKVLEAGLIPVGDRRIRIEVMNDASVNAFAIPGEPEAHVIITSGLLRKAVMEFSEGALAGVVTHEIAHIGERHSGKAMRVGIPILAVMTAAEIFSRTQSGQREHRGLATGIRAGSYLGGGAALAANSRSHEKGSDDAAIKVLPALGYDLEPLARFFTSLAQDLQRRGYRRDVVGGLFQSHPALESRAKKILAAAERQPAPTAGNSEEFIRIRERLAGRRR